MKYMDSLVFTTLVESQGFYKKSIVKHHKTILKNCFFPKIRTDLHKNLHFTYPRGRTFFNEQVAAIYKFACPIIKLQYIDKVSTEPVLLILIEKFKDKSEKLKKCSIE